MMRWKEWLRATPFYDWFGKRSYAQSGEDLIAWGEMENSKNQKHKSKKGFYVDVGAYHPKLFSNTYLFYKRGWRGVCVEPNPTMGGMYKLVRPRDMFVNVGVGGKTGNLDYYIFENEAANTFSLEQAKKNQKEAGRKLVSKKKIAVKTLKEILDEYVPKRQKIDLLSVDVEGMDEEVLRSNDWQKYRPEVIICEDLGFDWHACRDGVVGFLEKQGYKLIAKTPYSLIFRI